MSYEKEYRHCLENTNKRELVDKIIYDEKEFIKKDKEIERLKEENGKLKEKITISVNEEDVQNIINAYEKDIEYIKQLEKENKQLKEIIDKAIEYMKDFIFEPLLTNEDRKLIMYNDNLRNFEKILKEVE